MERFFMISGFREPVMLKLDHYGTPRWIWDAVLVMVIVAGLTSGLAIAYGR